MPTSSPRNRNIFFDGDALRDHVDHRVRDVTATPSARRFCVEEEDARSFQDQRMLLMRRVEGSHPGAQEGDGNFARWSADDSADPRGWIQIGTVCTPLSTGVARLLLQASRPATMLPTWPTSRPSDRNVCVRAAITSTRTNQINDTLDLDHSTLQIMATPSRFTQKQAVSRWALDGRMLRRWLVWSPHSHRNRRRRLRSE